MLFLDNHAFESKSSVTGSGTLNSSYSRSYCECSQGILAVLNQLTLVFFLLATSNIRVMDSKLQLEDDRDGLQLETCDKDKSITTDDDGTASPSRYNYFKYAVAVALFLVYFLLPVPAVFAVGHYLSASSSSALSSLISFSFPSTSSFSSSSSSSCHQSHHCPLRETAVDDDDQVHEISLHAKGYRAIFGAGSHHRANSNAFFAKGRPSFHAGPRTEEYNKNIEKTFLGIPNNESCIAASRRSVHLHSKLRPLNMLTLYFICSYTGIQHVSGTPGDYEIAHVVKQQWEKLLGLPVTGRNTHVYDAGSKQSKRALLSKSDGGVRVWTDTYYVLLKWVPIVFVRQSLRAYSALMENLICSHPEPFSKSKTHIKLFDKDGNLSYQAKLREDAVELDPTSEEGHKNAPPFHGYSKAGQAEGQLVYARVSNSSLIRPCSMWEAC